MRSAVGQVQGFQELRLRSRSVEIALLPELGAKVISLKNLSSGREWLWRPTPEFNLFKNQIGDDFARSTIVGWDECIPTIAACECGGRLLPDHGEAWSARWDLAQDESAAGNLLATVNLPISWLRFSRALRLLDNRLLVRYSLTNPTDQPQKFIWAMHPLIAIRPGDTLDLTEETRSFLTKEPWLDSLEFPGAGPRFAKVFAGPLHEGRAAIFNTQTKDRLTFSWNAVENPFLGVWLTRGGWNGYHHLALEPTNARTDSLDHAVNQTKTFGSIPPNATREWSVSITLEPADTSNIQS